MDFGSLLYAAHKNDKTANKDTIKCYKTKFEPPKKEIKTKANLSANIQKYLQKRDEEEKRKAEEEKKKKEELLALRSQDRKAFKRVQTMLKRTKSANKSVMEDAIDDVNTVVTMAGPQQCDEDDYGYVSQEASAFYAKLMDKYANQPPEEPKFPQEKKAIVKDLNAAKDRVRAALQKEEEEEMMPHKRKRKSKSDKMVEESDQIDEVEVESTRREPSPVEEPKPKKPKKIAPPPMDFSSLLKLAETKQFEPIKIEKKIKEDDAGRPMTKKQRIEYEQEREWRQRKMERENAMKNGQRRPDSTARIPKLSSNADGNDKKDTQNGLGRIPKKSYTATNSPRVDSFSEGVKRKDSIDSDSGSRSYSDTDRSRNNNKYQARNDGQSRTSYDGPSLSRNDSQSRARNDGQSEAKYRSDKYPNPKSNDKNRPGVDKSRENPRSEPSKAENSNESPTKQQSAEEVLKKSASVWSKPCNLTPSSKPPTSTGLSASQIERLRQMNKKPTLSKPVEDRFRSSQSDGRSLPPRPGGVPSGKPNSLKAAAAAASRAATNLKSQERVSGSQQKPSERQSSKHSAGPSQPSTSGSILARELTARDSRPKQFPPNDMRPKQFPPKDLKPKQFPPSDLKPRPRDGGGRPFPPHDLKKKPKPRRIDDSDSEYDSDMNDFIDDGPDMNADQISQEIQSIFGSKYRTKTVDDDDDECMESNFGQIDKEEYRSLIEGAKEDFAELQRDLEEKKRRKKRKMEMLKKR